LIILVSIDISLNKISLITDIKGIPLDAYLEKRNYHDAKIIINQLDNSNSYIDDKAYDSLRK
jgi:hypothetical protein